MGKLVARLENIRWQAQEVIQAVFTTRIVILVLAALVVWGSGGYIRGSACITAIDQQQLQLPGLSYAAEGSSSSASPQQLGYGDVPGYSPPYILPKIIHQTVEDRTAMSCQVRDSIQTWIDMNPGYTHKLYDGKDRLEFVREHYPELLDMYTSLPSNVERADTWRYLALHKLGGVYADSDVKCMQPISTWNADHGHDAALLVGIAKRSRQDGTTQEFNQFVMASMPGHPVMASMPLIIASNFAVSFLRGSTVAEKGSGHDTGVLSRTGPGAFTAALKLYSQRVGGQWPINSTLADKLGGILFGTVRAMPKFVLGMGWETIDYNMTCLEVKQKVRPEAYICHQFFGTWKKSPEVEVNSVRQGLTYTDCEGSLRYNEYSSTSGSQLNSGSSSSSGSNITGASSVKR